MKENGLERFEKVAEWTPVELNSGGVSQKAAKEDSNEFFAQMRGKICSGFEKIGSGGGWSLKHCWMCAPRVIETYKSYVSPRK